VLVAIVVVASLAACVRTYGQPLGAATDEERACVEDDDCALVDDWYCGCDAATNVDSVDAAVERRPRIAICGGPDQRSDCGDATEALCLSGRCTLIE
jgi:hypothetical protein